MMPAVGPPVMTEVATDTDGHEASAPVSGVLPRRLAAKAAAAFFVLALLAPASSSAQGEAGQTWELVVCADPHAMPLSDRSAEGYENVIAGILAEELGATLSFDWYPQMQDMIDLRLRGGYCDVVMGVPDGAEPLLTTISYYTSPYVFVYRADAGIEVTSLDDPVLSELRIGLQNAGMPPHDSLLARGLADSIVAEYGSTRYAPRDDPQARLVEAVLAGEVDVGVSWGPSAGYYAAQHPGELVVVPIEPAIDPMPPFTNLQLPMTIGVRQGDEALRDSLSLAIVRRWDDIQAVLEEYAVPLVDAGPAPAPPEQTVERLVVGYVGPNRTGSRTVAGSLFEVVGDAARAGALLAEDVMVSNGASSLDVVFANAPSADAAKRAAMRLVHLDGARVLIGGLGDGQAAALADVAAETGVANLNIGDDDPALRCTATFHVAPSADLYAAAIAARAGDAGVTRWHVVRLDDDRWSRVAETFGAIVAQTGAEVVGESVVAEADPVYADELNAAREEGADAVLVLLGAPDQIAFLAQAAALGPEMTIVPYPAVATQSRDYIAAASRLNPSGVPERVVMWETTLAEGPAADLNERFTSRFGRPMDPHAWAAYAAVTLVGQAAAETGGLEQGALEEFLLGGPHELAKGRPLAFDSDSRQLEQPLYVVRPVPGAPWGRNLSQQVGVAELVGAVDVPEVPGCQ